MNKQECAVVMEFTGFTMLKENDINIFYEYIKNIMGKPIYTHELPELCDEIKEKSRNDFIKLCENATDE